MNPVRVYVAAPKALASEVDAFHRWAHSHVAETRGRGASLEFTSLDFTSVGWVQSVLDYKGVDPPDRDARRKLWTSNMDAIHSANVMLAWTAVGEPRETLSEVGQWVFIRDGEGLIVVGSSRNAFLSDSKAESYIDASAAPDEPSALRVFWPRMVEAIFDAMA